MAVQLLFWKVGNRFHNIAQLLILPYEQLNERFSHLQEVLSLDVRLLLDSLRRIVPLIKRVQDVESPLWVLCHYNLAPLAVAASLNNLLGRFQ